MIADNVPTRNEFLARSACTSCPNGVKNGDFALKAAAIVRAGSRHWNKAAMRRNFPKCTSMGSLLSKRPRGVISCAEVSAFTCRRYKD